jgi:GNAT superfamily N-acetyltransferase
MTTAVASLAPDTVHPARAPELTIRGLAPGDRAALAFALSHLSDQSRYQRYLSPRPGVDHRELARLLDVDHWHHEVLIAFASGPRRPVGVAEYVRLAEFDHAELAVVIVDDWQRHGVGRSLAEALRERALAAGIRFFRVSLLRENRGALALARALGECAVTGSAGAVLEMLIAL